jgi:hypothetical protein
MGERDETEREFRQALEAVKATGSQFVFDREGRPGAIAAVRAALPLMERELFDAVIEDCECELAATREAMFRLVEGLKK